MEKVNQFWAKANLLIKGVPYNISCGLRPTDGTEIKKERKYLIMNLQRCFFAINAVYLKMHSAFPGELNFATQLLVLTMQLVTGSARRLLIRVTAWRTLYSCSPGTHRMPVGWNPSRLKSMELGTENQWKIYGKSAFHSFPMVFDQQVDGKSMENPFTWWKFTKNPPELLANAELIVSETLRCETPRFESSFLGEMDGFTHLWSAAEAQWATITTVNEAVDTTLINCS